MEAAPTDGIQVAVCKPYPVAGWCCMVVGGGWVSWVGVFSKIKRRKKKMKGEIKMGGVVEKGSQGQGNWR